MYIRKAYTGKNILKNAIEYIGTKAVVYDIHQKVFFEQCSFDTYLTLKFGAELIL